MSGRKRSAWVEHVLTYAREHGITYKRALTEAGKSYHHGKKQTKAFQELKEIGKRATRQEQVEGGVEEEKQSGEPKPKTSKSAWIEHVKAYAKEHGITYRQALKEAGESFHKGKKQKTALEKLEPIARKQVERKEERQKRKALSRLKPSHDPELAKKLKDCEDEKKRLEGEIERLKQATTTTTTSEGKVMRIAEAEPVYEILAKQHPKLKIYYQQYGAAPDMIKENVRNRIVNTLTMKKVDPELIDIFNTHEPTDYIRVSKDVYNEVIERQKAQAEEEKQLEAERKERIKKEKEKRAKERQGVAIRELTPAQIEAANKKQQEMLEKRRKKLEEAEQQGKGTGKRRKTCNKKK